jgi:hypothetical protein
VGSRCPQIAERLHCQVTIRLRWRKALKYGDAKPRDNDLDNSTASCLVVLLVIVGVCVAALLAAANAAAKRTAQLNAAWGEYQQALQWVRYNPGRSELRVQALALGRSYYSLARKDGVPTIYDEMALANDLNAFGSETQRPGQP